MTHPLITNRRFISPSGRLQVQYAGGSGTVGYVFDDASGPCVPFATLGPSPLIRCFRTGVNLPDDFSQTDADLQVWFTGTSLLAKVRCHMWNSHPPLALLSHFAFV